MKEIKVLGSGCAKCVKTAEFIQQVANDCNVSVNVIKETNPEIIMSYGVMSTPAVVVDNQLMHSGSMPDRKKIEEWLISTKR
jgi:thiol-disulfide isomerase/thioredoxin